MAYLLRTLITIMVLSILLTMSSALGWIAIPNYGHIHLAIPSFLLTIFVQAFVMFYFIGVSRLVNNIYQVLNSNQNLEQLFDQPPADLTPYKKKVDKFVYDSTVSKRQTIPWTMMMLVLGSIAFLLGGAHDTGLVSKVVHQGVAYGFFAAMIIGFVRQWYFLGKTHGLLRAVKSLFEIPDQSM